MRYNLGNDNFTEAVTETPVVTSTVDATVNDNDKSFVVPEGEMWKVNDVFVTFISAANVGNRQIIFEINDVAGNVLERVSAGAVQAASLTRYYSFIPGGERDTAFVDGGIIMPIPSTLYLLSGQSIRIRDSANIAAGVDDMTVALNVSVYKGV